MTRLVCKSLAFQKLHSAKQVLICFRLLIVLPPVPLSACDTADDCCCFSVLLVQCLSVALGLLVSLLVGNYNFEKICVTQLLAHHSGRVLCCMSLV